MVPEDGTTPVTIGLILAVVGGFADLAGILRAHDGKISSDSGWKGQVNTKLDQIATSAAMLPGISERLTKVDESSKQAHKRLDEMMKSK